MQGTIIFGLIFAILIAIFAIQNASIVALNILMWEFEISLAVVVLGSIIFGALVIGIFSYFKQFQLKRKNKNLKLEIQSLKEELDDLKEEKSRLERYSPESSVVDSSQKEESQEEKPKEKRGFFGLGKKSSKEKEAKSEEAEKEVKEETETEEEKEKNKSENKDIAYNLEEDDTEEEKNN